jgi:hypothetical protein
MVRRRCIACAVDQVLEAKERIPGVRRDDDESPIGTQHAARRRERRSSIGKMLEHADEQDELKLIRAMHAEIHGIADAKLQRHAGGVAPGARDHGGTDVDTEPTSDDIGKVKQDLPGATAEIEHARPMEIAAKRTKIVDTRGKFRRTRRRRALLRIPDVSDKIEVLSRPR